MTKSRNHEYLYTVQTRHEFDSPVTDSDGNVKKDAEGNVKTYRKVEWNATKVQGRDMAEVAGKLHLTLDDVRYLHKEVIT